jgi:hypothetical protein
LPPRQPVRIEIENPPTKGNPMSKGIREQRWARQRAVMVATVAVLAGAAAAAPAGAADTEARPLQVTPASGAWFTNVSIAGSGCTAAAGTELMVTGAVHRGGGAPPQEFGRFSAIPGAEGSWSAAIVVTHVGGDPMGVPEPTTPGPYEVRAVCGPVTDPVGSGPRPGEPYVTTYTAPFLVLPGGPTPTMQTGDRKVTITDGVVRVTASGDRCARPDGDSTGYAYIEGPEGADRDDPAVTYHAAYFFTASPDGHWSGTLVPSPGDTPKPGVYQLRAECWLGTAGQQSQNGFGYEPITITLVAGSPTTTTTTLRQPQPVAATPVYTG